MLRLWGQAPKYPTSRVRAGGFSPAGHVSCIRRRFGGCCSSSLQCCIRTAKPHGTRKVVPWALPQPGSPQFPPITTPCSRQEVQETRGRGMGCGWSDEGGVRSTHHASCFAAQRVPHHSTMWRHQPAQEGQLQTRPDPLNHIFRCFAVIRRQGQGSGDSSTPPSSPVALTISGSILHCSKQSPPKRRKQMEKVIFPPRMTCFNKCTLSSFLPFLLS